MSVDIVDICATDEKLVAFLLCQVVQPCFHYCDGNIIVQWTWFKAITFKLPYCMRCLMLYSRMINKVKVYFWATEVIIAKVHHKTEWLIWTRWVAFFGGGREGAGKHIGPRDVRTLLCCANDLLMGPIVESKQFVLDVSPVVLTVSLHHPFCCRLSNWLCISVCCLEIRRFSETSVVLKACYMHVFSRH